jgi:probable HAF family extracellular repeat protein
MRDRIRCSFTFVVPFILLLASGSGPVATANPPAPTYTIIDLGTLGGDRSFATGINTRGQVVGESAPTAGPFRPGHAFLWEAGTGMQDLGTLGGASSGAEAINARGQIVGWSTTVGGPSHAFLWEAGTGMQDLGTLGGPHSHAYGINARGQIVGWASTTTGAMHAFLWEAGTGMQDLVHRTVSSLCYSVNVVPSGACHASHQSSD